MDIRKFVEILGFDFFTGVPDSQLKPLCDYLTDTYGTDPRHHVIGANEGNCTAVAAGYHLATGKVPVVYLQNSGQGNIINPVASLLHPKVYAIPCLFVIGWRGEPGVHDEPQHVYQGEVTVRLLEDMDVACFVVDKETTESTLRAKMREFELLLNAGRQAAFVIKKGAFVNGPKIEYRNENAIGREEAIRHITAVSQEDPIVSTTGKASRELYEIREADGKGHGYDFLTVGSMGHSSSIALGIALFSPDKKVWCVDGDGAALMHMGAMAVIGASAPENLVHAVINNGAHETVGGMPTVARTIELTKIAKACGYKYATRVGTLEELDEQLYRAKRRKGLTLIEILCSIGSRSDLGRPTSSPVQNKKEFMENMRQVIRSRDC